MWLSVERCGTNAARGDSQLIGSLHRVTLLTIDNSAHPKSPKCYVYNPSAGQHITSDRDNVKNLSLEQQNTAIARYGEAKYLGPRYSTLETNVWSPTVPINSDKTTNYARK